MNPTIMTEVVRKDLCIGCGVCAALCPKKLLEMRWDHRQELVPVEASSCEKECGLCLKVCPFAGPNDNEDIIGKRLYGAAPEIRHVPDAGYYQSSFVGYSNDERRAHGASGGTATWLLEKMLKEDVVDRVICVTPDSGDSSQLFRFKVIDTPEGVQEGAGSVYCQVEMSGAIRHILDNPGRYAITGLPCAIKAIRLAQKNNKKLEERIKITIGLVCGQTKNMSFTQYIGILAGIQGRLKKVKYRCKSPDRPATNYHMVYLDDTGMNKTIIWREGGIAEAWVNRWFAPTACSYCDDVFAECADIACMDAWLPEYSSDSRGTSIILIRSSLLTQLVHNSIQSREISMKPIPIEEVLRSQSGAITIKRKYLPHRLYRGLQRGMQVPEKRVAPSKNRNLFIRRTIDNMIRMQELSKELWDTNHPNAKHFKDQMNLYLTQISRDMEISNSFTSCIMIITFPVRVIKRKMGIR